MLLLSVLAILYAATGPTHATILPFEPSHELSNANHIFNAIHNSMRQFGSSVHHNGMSFFIATVPQGTRLYHGTSSPDPVNGTEWLSLEPEHAFIFASPQFPHLPPPNDPDHDDDQNGDGRRRHMISYQPEAQLPLSSARHREAGDETESLYGYLHTYRARHGLRLLYLDGQSAAKSDKGTLDTQDVVLLHPNPPPNRQPASLDERWQRTEDGRGFMGELDRAAGLCELARADWGGRVDGFVRMEVGFEVILCSFADHLDVERITAARTDALDAVDGRIVRETDRFEWFKAAASRFDGIGGRRVRVQYDRFVTLFATPDAMSFDRQGMPRAKNDSALLDPVREAVRDLATGKGGDDINSDVDWQEVADMVIMRYADRIDHLCSGNVEDIETLRASVNATLRPFVDVHDRDQGEELARCATHVFPGTPDRTSLAANAILNVTTTICSTFFSILNTNDGEDALTRLRNLRSWLDWATWKRCRGCRNDEVCFLAIWPLGGVEDHETPNCKSNFTKLHNDYWGFERLGSTEAFE